MSGTNKLEVLPSRIGSAAENMAIDFLLLQRYPQAEVPRFRHYGWRSPAFTFGYAQKIAVVREKVAAIAGRQGGGTGILPMKDVPFSPAAFTGGTPMPRQAPGPDPSRFDLCRRPTGGGVVDHRDDWTYALVIPRGHPGEELRATQSYRLVHEVLAAALEDQGVPCRLQAHPAEPDDRANEGPPTVGTVKAGLPSVALAKEGVCFERAEIHDVVHANSGDKIAGAAQKRNKRGLLFQGSLWRPAAGGAAVDWEKFENDFVGRLAAALGADAGPTPWPEFNEDEVSGLTEQYSAPEWNEAR